MAALDTPTFRMDRWLTLSVVAPLSAAWPISREAAIPILMYHSVADDVDASVHPYFRTVTTPATFVRQINFLQRQGYAAVTLSEAVHQLRSSGRQALAPRRTVVLTFDDGFRDFFTTAYPVLERADYRATVFLASAYLNKPFLNGRECLRTAEIRALSRQGIEFGSHSVNHHRLVELTPTALAHEVAASRAAIQDITGKDVTLFSYPYRFPQENAAFIARLGDLLDAHGYRAGVTTTIGRSRGDNDLRFLPRLPINDCDDTELLQAKLEGHYDWLRTGQLMRKKSRALLHHWRPA